MRAHGADGIGLVFADPTAGATPTSLGGTGGPWASAAPCRVVKFDTFKNERRPSANFVGSVHHHPDRPHPWPQVQQHGGGPDGAAGREPVTRHVVVKTSILNGKTIIRSVTVDGVNVITTGLMQLPPSVLIGFSSATGTSTDTHIVANVVVGYRP